MVKKIKIKGIGDIDFYFNKNVSRINISISKSGEVLVNIPFISTIEEAVSFTKSKIKWIKKNKTKIEKLEIKIIDPDISKILLIPFEKSMIRKLNKISVKYNFIYNKIRFKTMYSRWGSCSSLNNISLNNLLLYVEEDLQDYVLKHELVHTKIKNHSKLFWSELENICPNYKYAKEKLNNSFTIKPKHKIELN